MRLRSSTPWTLSRLGRYRVAFGRLGAAGSLVALAGCGGVETVDPFTETIKDPAKLYMRLAIDHRAVALSVGADQYKTIQLTATPRDVRDSAMTGLPAPTFTSLDTTMVTVTADGLVTAQAVTDSVLVVASLTVGPVAHADTTMIMVTDLATPPVLDRISIQPVPTDPSVWPAAPGTWWMPHVGELGVLPGVLGALGLLPPPAVPATGGGIITMRLIPRASAADGAAIEGLPYRYTSLDPAVARVIRYDGKLALIGTGTVRMVVQTTAYGVARADTATFTVVPPYATTFLSFEADPSGDFAPPGETRIATNGIVMWVSVNAEAPTVTVTFDDPTHVGLPPAALCDRLPEVFLPPEACGAGDVVVPADPLGGGIRLRQFAVPGVYTYHVMPGNRTGRIVVGDEFR